jgi:predicted alpha/beta hydrolase family esterase
MRQVFVIHGGNAFDTYEEYLEYLKGKQVTLADLDYKDWKHGLQSVLGEGYKVFTPRMPNGNNAKYLEWKLYFEKFLPLLDDDAIFVGHSLGGIFLAKYFSEEVITKKVKAVFLVAAPYNTASQHSLADFIFPEGVASLEKNVDQIFLYHSTDDVVVPFSNFKQFMEDLPHAESRVFEGRNHINQTKFPELVADIQSLA